MHIHSYIMCTHSQFSQVYSYIMCTHYIYIMYIMRTHYIYAHTDASAVTMSDVDDFYNLKPQRFFLGFCRVSYIDMREGIHSISFAFLEYILQHKKKDSKIVYISGSCSLTMKCINVCVCMCVCVCECMYVCVCVLPIRGYLRKH